MRPVLEADTQGLTNQQGAESGAVDEQVALNATAVVQFQRFDVGIGRAGEHVPNLAFHATHAKAFAELAQEARVATGVEMERIVDAAVRQVRKTRLLGGTQFKAVVAIVAGESAMAAFQPEVLEAGGPVVLAGRAEGVDVVLVSITPVLEADTELDCRLGRGHEFLFVDVEQTVEGHQGRNGRLADANRADFFGLDQRNVEYSAKSLRQGCGGHPACGTATGDHHAANGSGVVSGVHLVLLSVVASHPGFIAPDVAGGVRVHHRRAARPADPISAAHVPECARCWFRGRQRRSAGTVLARLRADAQAGCAD